MKKRKTISQLSFRSSTIIKSKTNRCTTNTVVHYEKQLKPLIAIQTFIHAFRFKLRKKNGVFEKRIHKIKWKPSLRNVYTYFYMLTTILNGVLAGIQGSLVSLVTRNSTSTSFPRSYTHTNDFPYDRTPPNSVCLVYRNRNQNQRRLERRRQWELNVHL